MNRRQLTFVILVNALISFLFVLGVTWFIDSRRPDPEELAALYAPPPPAVATATAALVPAVTALVLATTEPVASDIPNIATPSTQELYTVQEGDSLLGIALKYNVTLADLMAANELGNPDFVFVGQRLAIPRGRSTPQSEAGGAPSAPPPGTVQIAAVENPGVLATEAALVVNESDLAITLQGWSLSKEGGPVYTFGIVPLFPGGSIRLHSTGGVDSSIDLYWGQPAAVWPTGSLVRLLNAGGDLVAQYAVP